MLQLGLTQQETEASLLEFQLANKEALNLSDEKELQLRIKQLQLNQQFQKQADEANKKEKNKLKQD